jgi:heme exporter protein A
MEAAIRNETLKAPPAASGPGPAIVLRELRRDYGERPVLRGVTLDLAGGKTLAVLGPNGAGKSTLLRILATLLRPTTGTASVLGAELPRQAWRVRGRIGYLGHEPLLYRELTVRENLEFNARLHRIQTAGSLIDELLAEVGLARRGDELVRNLSAGMAQRAAICRALLPGPEMLLLDEPRSHLDLDAADRVEQLLGPTAGRTRVVVTHEVERALAEADAALVLTAVGAVAYAGPAAGITAGEARAAYSGALR